VDTILGDVVQHISPDRAYENLLPQLQSVVEKILTHMTDFSQIFGMVKFLEFPSFFSVFSFSLSFSSGELYPLVGHVPVNPHHEG